MGTDLKFWSLVEVFESLAQPSTKAAKGSALSRKEKEAKLAELMFERYRAGPHKEASLYPLARLLCPRLDQKGRAMYQLKEKGLADVGPLDVPTPVFPRLDPLPSFPHFLLIIVLVLVLVLLQVIMVPESHCHESPSSSPSTSAAIHQGDGHLGESVLAHAPCIFGYARQFPVDRAQIVG
jgi:hypothetical protein